MNAVLAEIVELMCVLEASLVSLLLGLDDISLFCELTDGRRLHHIVDFIATRTLELNRPDGNVAV